MKRAILINDTSFANHHGCKHVCENIKKAFKERCDIEILQDYRIGKKLELDRLAKIDCDYIVINGEGTIHSGRETALKLLKIASEHDKPAFLINAMYDNNPDDWLQYLNDFALVSVRDEASYEYLKGKITSPLFLTSDISLYQTQATSPAPIRRGIYIGDSVLKGVKKNLYKLSKSRKYFYMPITGRRKHGASAFSISTLKTRLKTMFNPKTMVFDDSSDFISELKKAELYITGRFHGVCLAIKTKTPFLTFSSNTKKIEVMLKTIGLESRMKNEVSSNLLDVKEYTFTEDEYSKISKFMAKSQEDWNLVFAEIKNITLEIK